jgi:hypothetical protein
MQGHACRTDEAEVVDPSAARLGRWEDPRVDEAEAEAEADERADSLLTDYERQAQFFSGRMDARVGDGFVTAVVDDAVLGPEGFPLNPRTGQRCRVNGHSYIWSEGYWKRI